MSAVWLKRRCLSSPLSFLANKSIFTHKGGFIPSIILFPLITITKNTRENNA